jgi:MraZ protein
MSKLILGEAARLVDERFRLSIPAEFVEALAAARGECVLAKEQPGCLSLWNAADWQGRWQEAIQLVEAKLVARRLEGRLDDLQRLGRLLSTRHRPVQLAGRGRLVIPEGFREFLAVEPNGTVMIVGAAVCVELWQPEKWHEQIGCEMPEFGGLLARLVG